ncbi:MAG: hypothetical protein CMK92_00460 [Pseudomonas sp.]|nr:hypothetical protein [Pseudomonas sp.]|tara:strand:- start:27 stop:218 length:192 start_codon:yes stop_codon:yes gene_type:complete
MKYVYGIIDDWCGVTVEMIDWFFIIAAIWAAGLALIAMAITIATKVPIRSEDITDAEEGDSDL